MKDIEQLFKDALNQHELPYDIGAWESMSKRLGPEKPSPFSKKWWLVASAGVILVSSATYFFLRTQEEPKTHLAVNHTEETVAARNPNAPAQNNALHLETSGKTHSETGSSESIQPESTPVNSANRNNTVTQSGRSNTTVDHSSGTASTFNKSNEKREDRPTASNGKSNHSPNEEHIALSLPDQVCVNTSFEIYNPFNSKSVYAITGSQARIEIEPHGRLTVKVTETTGTIQVFSDSKLEKVVTVVQPKGKLYLEVDPTLIYENGIPALRFSASGNDKNVTWNSGKIPSEMDQNEFVVHPYTTQDITVTATSKDENGCPVEEQKSIHLDERYNLMAVKAFIPTSNDPRLTTFMPFALTERNTSFELYIYEPKSGRVIYSTNDVNAPWTGFDKISNEMVPVGSVWLWKVILHKPNAGEPNEYKGTVTRL